MFGDASNYNVALAHGLRCEGHQVTIASDGSGWLATHRDIDLSRPLPGRLGGLALWLRLNTTLRHRLSGYDIVQIASPDVVKLRPERAIKVFRMLKASNRAIYLTSLGTDTFFVERCLDPNGLRYNEWRIGSNPGPLQLAQPEKMAAWLHPLLRRNATEVYQSVDGIATALYEYHDSCSRIVSPNRLKYTGIPICTDKLTMAPGRDSVPKIVEIFLGRHSRRCIEKGTDRLLTAAKRVAERHPSRCRLTVVEDIPYSQYEERMRSAHIMLDQLYSYTPATNALLAMAQGIVAVSGAEPEFYDFIGEHENRPIVNAIPDDDKLVETLENLVLHPEQLPELWHRSREFVVKHNDARVVARRFLTLWHL